MPNFVVYRPQFTPHKKTLAPDVVLTEYSAKLEEVSRGWWPTAEVALAAHRTLSNPSPILEEIIHAPHS